MKTIGIKLADGTFYPVLEEGTPKKRMLDLTTAKDNQTKVQIDLYRSETGSMDDAEYVDTLEVTKLNPHPNGEPELHLSVGLDENNNLTAEVVDPETGKKSETEVSLVSRTEAERAEPADFAITGSEDATVADDSTEAGTDETLAADSNGIVDADHTSDNADETTFSPDDLPDINSSALEDMPFSFDHSEPHVTSEISPAAAGTSSAEGFKGELPDFSDLDNDIPVEDKTLESVDFSKDSLDDIDESNDIIGTESPDLTEDTTADIQTDTTTIADSDNFSTEDFSLPEFGNDDPTVADDSISEDDTTVADDTTLPDFGDDSTDTTLPDFGDDSTDTTLPDFGDDSNDTTLPDFGDDFGSNIDTSTDSTDFDFP
ncbi:MAG: Hsp70 family protein, partial [Treponema sp.]|nr:Hsp70 family protein [Treponema sp.]